MSAAYTVKLYSTKAQLKFKIAYLQYQIKVC